MKNLNLKIVLFSLISFGAMQLWAAPNGPSNIPINNNPRGLNGALPPGHGGIPPGQIGRQNGQGNNGNGNVGAPGLNRVPPGLAKKLGSEEAVKFINSSAPRSINAVFSSVNRVSANRFKHTEGEVAQTFQQNQKNNRSQKNLSNENSEDAGLAFPNLARGLIYIPKSAGGSLVKVSNNRMLKPVASGNSILFGTEDNPLTVASLKSLTPHFNSQSNPNSASFWFKEKGQNFQGWTEQCFTADTLISLSDRKVLKIKEIKVGDSVLSFNAQKNTIEKAQVTKVFKREADFVLLIKTSNQKTIKVTEEHPFWSGGAWVPAKNLKVGSLLVTSDLKEERVLSIEKLLQKNTVHNFEVQNNHTYIAEGFIVHNKCILRDGKMVNIPDSLVNPAKDIVMPSLVEFEEPVISFLKLHPQKGYLIGEYPEIASNIVSGVVGYLGNDVSNLNSFSPSEQKSLMIDLVLMTLEFGPDAASQVLISPDPVQIASYDPQIISFINKSTPLRKLFFNVN